ncbi:hypothetical protein ACQ4PT_031978 [Festuca glaucescens]
MGNSRGTARGAAGGSSDAGREDGVAGTPRASGGPATRGTAARSGANEARQPSQGGPGELGPRSPGPERGSPGISHGTKTFVNKGNGNASSTGREEDTGTQRAPGGPAIPAPAARSGATGAAPRLPLRGGPVPRSSGPSRERGSTGPGNVVSPCSDQQQSGAASDTVKSSVSCSLSRDSDRSAGSPNGAETPRSEDARDGNGTSLLKKRKRLGNSRNYVNLFKTAKRANDADVAVASPDRVGKENTSSGHVADSNISKLHKGSRLTENNKRHSSDDACKVSRSLGFGLHETSETRVNQDSVPVSEIKNTLGDGEPISIQKEVSASGHSKVIPSDQTDGNSNICVACGTSGTLSCTNKRFQFGLHSVVDGIESVWDVKEAEGMQNSKLYFVKYKNLAHVHNRWVPEVDINITPGGPDLLSLFNKRNHTEKAIWKEEWTKPHRLLRKRLLIPPKLADDFFSSSGVKYSYCTLEWMIDKLATKKLKTESQVKQSSFQKLERLPDGCHSDFDNDHLFSINHLREFWYKSRGAVLVDDKSGAAGGKSMGDILEGVVCDRFGRESYERIESGAPLSRKHAAVNMFNDKTKGRFVFLIESRACLPSVKLSSIDAVIIYNSDCNPLNDLKAIQRIKIESQKYPGIFRLYTPFTMEEKQLVLAKDGELIGNYKDIPHSLCHSVISWGALFLFTRFDELQHGNYASKSFERDTVILEFLKLAINVEDSTELNCTSISKANMSGEFYSRSIALIGENVAMPASDGDPSNFWLNLLDGKSPCWSNISEPQQSSHRLVQNIEEPARVPAEEADEGRRKRRKVDGITVPSSKRSFDNSHDDILPKKCYTVSPHLQQFHDTHQKEGTKKLTTPKNLHVQLKQELSKLIKVLQLPDNARLQAEQFFEYYLNNHLVPPEPADILHAFNIALCWRAASHVNYKVDRRESVALAEKSFNCEYNEALAGLIYTKLRTLKKKFPNRAGETSIKGQPVSAEDTQLSWQETSTNLENDNMFQNKEIDLHGNFTNGAPQEVSSVPEETRKECHVPNDEPPNMIVEKNIDLIDSVFSLRKNNILCKQQLEISGLVTHRQNNVMRLKEVCTLVLEHIRRSHIDEMTRTEKIKLTAQWFVMLMYAFLGHMKLQHDKLEGLQSDTWSSERQLKEKLYQVAKSGQLDKDFDRHIALPDSNFVMEEFIHLKEQNDEYHIAESSVSDCQQSSNDALSMESTLVRSEALSEPISIHAMENEPVETSVGSGGGPASEATDFQENNIQFSSDGIIVQRAGCSSSTIPANDDSTGQESSTSECRNTEHIEIDNIAKPIILPGGATSLVRGGHANNDGILDTDGVHLESPNLTSSQSLAALVGTQAVLSCMPPQQSTDPSAQQTVAPSQCPPAEAEQTGLSGTQEVQVLQPEMQPSILLSDAPPQKTHPDDRSQAGCQLDRATGLSKGGAATSHHLGDVRMQVQEKDDGNVVADPVLPEPPTYPADITVTLQV